nr:uncharacterized protein LOC112016710 [Ipomoea trifida]
MQLGTRPRFTRLPSCLLALISSFLHLHIIDDDGHHKADICKLSKLILPLGDITRVLFHIVLMDLDREFKKRFSSIRYYRLLDEVYILTNDVIFDDKAGYALLEELGLAGQIESIGPGDDPLLCRRTKLRMQLGTRPRFTRLPSCLLAKLRMQLGLLLYRSAPNCFSEFPLNDRISQFG